MATVSFVILLSTFLTICGLVSNASVNGSNGKNTGFGVILRPQQYSGRIKSITLVLLQIFSAPRRTASGPL